jgi:serine/threonine protein kinase/tetratricopeptide (TPR) repeat protein
VEHFPPDERPAYLDRACAGNPALRTEVEILLRAHGETDGLLDRLDRELAQTADGAAPCDGTGTIIGPYKLLEEIGAGGMGVVYMAEQAAPVCRKVALKIIKPGMDSRQVVARFEAERQALALMDHPHIARVHDAGATESGRPFFVMELVKGIPITDYCDRNRLAIAERLELFAQVGQAVQHAHQKGIIHRDLKPSNILVTLIDGASVPKIIDFGVAKAMGQQLTERTLFTGFAQLIGTPLYMSPEQAAFSGVDVDTRSDIYSLGVLLYELLTGTTPFDAETFRTAAYDEIRRIIREDEPPKPSTRILLPPRRGGALGLPPRTPEAGASTVSANRQTDPRRLSKSLRGELDWIVMKCLEKDRNRRYGTANTLVADVRRYLNHEPVEACPPSAWYRVRKFGRRNRAVLATAMVVAAALVAGTAVSTWQAIRATNAEGLARVRLAAEQKARGEADRRRQIAESNFRRACILLHNAPLKHQMEWMRPEWKPWRETQTKVLFLFQRLLSEPGPDPGDRLLTAEVHRELADIYRSIWQGPEAFQEYQKAVALLRPLVAEFPQEAGFRDSLAHCFWGMGWLHKHSLAGGDRTRPENFRDDFLAAIDLYEALRKEFQDMPWYRLRLAECWWQLGEAYRTHGQFQRGEDALRRALALYQSLLKESPHSTEQRLDVARLHNHLAWVLATRPDRTPQHTAEALEHAQKAVDLDPSVDDWWHTLGVAHCRMGHWTEALACIEKSRQLQGATGPRDAWAGFFEAMAYSGLGDKVQARRCYDESVQWLEKNAPEHADLRRFRGEVDEMLQVKNHVAGEDGGRARERPSAQRIVTNGCGGDK